MTAGARRKAGRRLAEGPFLGTLCARGHDHEGTGKSLRHRSGHCARCFQDRANSSLAENPSRRAAYLERSRKQREKVRRAKGIAPRVPRTPDRDREYNAAWRRRWRADNPTKAREAARERYRRETIKTCLRNRVWRAFKMFTEQGKIYSCGGYGIDIAAIASRLGPCPGPRNEWHIDHIRPLASFDFNDPAQIQAAFSPENHQWLPAKQNLQKSWKWKCA